MRSALEFLKRVSDAAWDRDLSALRIVPRGPGTLPPRRYIHTLQVFGAGLAGDVLVGFANPPMSKVVCYVNRLAVKTVIGTAAGGQTALVVRRATYTVNSGADRLHTQTTRKDKTAPLPTMIAVLGGTWVDDFATDSTITLGGITTPATLAASDLRDEWIAKDWYDRFVLRANEGLNLRLIAAGDADDQYWITAEWEEVPRTS